MKKSELFDLYLENKLQDKELKEFKARLNEEPDFNKEFQRMKEIRYAVRHNARLEVRDMFDRFEKELSNENKNAKKPLSKVPLIVSIVLIGLLAIAYFSLTSKTLSLQEAYSKYYQTPPLDVLFESSSIDLNSYKSGPILAYQSGNYQLANQNLIGILDSIHEADLYLISGVSALETKSSELAIDRLNILLNKFNKHTESALWFSSMAFLSADKNAEAICTLYALTQKETDEYDGLKVLNEIGIQPSKRTSLGIVESLLLETDSLSSSEYIPTSQKGIISDLTTRNRYEFHLSIPIPELEEGQIVDYVTLETITDINPIGIAFIKED